MKRSPLRRSTAPLRRTPIRKRSAKMKALYAGKDGRRMFVSVFLADNPYCEVKWEDCQQGSRDVHEVIPRGIGGAILPGEKADRQGQRFVAICRRCHGDLDLQKGRAKAEGWVHSYSANDA